MPQLHALVQCRVLENAEAFPANPRVQLFQLGEADAVFAEADARPEVVPFVSIELAWRIQRSHPDLARRLVFSPERLGFHLAAQAVGGAMLNSRFLIVPWGALPTMLDQLHRALGDSLFVRPNSATKPFTGFCGDRETLVREHRSLGQLEHIPPDELCVIAPAAELEPIEWRFWVVDSEPITYAAYAWSDDVERPSTPPANVLELARHIAPRTEVLDSAIVLDIGVVAASREPRVLELNPLSTSGLHPGMDIVALLDALPRVMATTS